MDRRHEPIHENPRASHWSEIEAGVLLGGGASHLEPSLAKYLNEVGGKEEKEEIASWLVPGSLVPQPQCPVESSLGSHFGHKIMWGEETLPGKTTGKN